MLVNTFILILLLKVYNSQIKFYESLSVDFTLLNKQNATVSISENKDIGSCVCNLTPKACDYNCCCDSDCPSKLTKSWISDPRNICLDKKISDDNYFTYCFDEKYLYAFNRKRGMREYRDSATGLFCVTFDNSSIMESFFKNIQTLSQQNITYIMKTYVDNRVKSYYYPEEKIFENKFFYEPGDNILVKSNKTTTFIKNGNFFIQGKGTFGECTINRAVKFLNNQERITCGKRLSSLIICDNTDWKDFLNAKMSFISVNAQKGNNLNLKLNKIFKRDAISGLLTEVFNFTQSTQMSVIQDTNECICNNVLQEVEFNIIVNSYELTIQNVYVDVVLLDNIKGMCTDKYLIDFASSVKFMNSLKSIPRSGNPGYIIGNNILIAYNATVNNKTVIQTERDGFYIVGKSNDQVCRNGDGYPQGSIYDIPIRFLINNYYSCQILLNYEEYKNFCLNKDWRNLKIFNFARRLQLIGIFGNAKIDSHDDWFKVINEFNLEDSIWTEEDLSCKFPFQIFFDLLYSETESNITPQKYIVSARLSVKYTTIKFTNDLSVQQKFKFSFNLEYINLQDNILNLTRKYPSILPQLPNDISYPFVE